MQSASTIKSSKTRFSSPPSPAEAISWSDDVMRHLHSGGDVKSMAGDAWADKPSLQSTLVQKSIRRRRKSLMGSSKEQLNEKTLSDVVERLRDYLPFQKKNKPTQSPDPLPTAAPAANPTTLPRSLSLTQFLDPNEDPMHPVMMLEEAQKQGHRGAPAFTRIYSQHAQTTIWDACTIVKIDLDKREYLVEVTVRNQVKSKWIKRQNLRIGTESEEAFAAWVTSGTTRQHEFEDAQVGFLGLFLTVYSWLLPMCPT
jgi:hypothetical protein